MSELMLMYMVCGIMLFFMILGAAGYKAKKKREAEEK